MNAELMRRLGSIAQIGTISEVQEDKALARVTILDRVTDFLPVLMFGNTFSKHFKPQRVGEQVLVIAPYGETNDGFILRGIFNQDCKEPVLANGTTEVLEYEDGTVILYDTKNKQLFVNAVGDITIKAGGNITLDAGAEIIATGKNFKWTAK